MGRRGFRKDEKGAIGIEILIVFIAIVLVAAVSAAVLIQTVGYLQQKATATGRETTQEVASGVKVIKVLGNVSNPRTASATIDKLAIIIETNTGGTDIDLTATRLILANESKSLTLVYNASAQSRAYSINTSGVKDLFSGPAWANLSANATQDGGPTKEFGIIVLQDEDGSLNDPAHPVLNRGDKVVLIVDAKSAFDGVGLKPRESVTGEVRPELGAPGIIEFTTPPSYTTVVVELQ